MADKTEIRDLEGKLGIVKNDWIIVGKRNGLNVRRKFKGLSTCVDINDNVQECVIYYFEQELYPNHTAKNPSIAKTEHKAYHLKNIGKRIKSDITFATNDDELDAIIETELRSDINTLDTYISEIGQAGIINPVNATLSDLDKLPLDSSNFYTLNSK